jgi:hypothetical protein
MKVKLIERKPVKVTCLRHVGPYGQPLSEFWQRTVYPWMTANDQLGQPRYGISLDDPMITAADKCRYDAAVPGILLDGRLFRSEDWRFFLRHRNTSGTSLGRAD